MTEEKTTVREIAEKRDPDQVTNVEYRRCQNNPRLVYTNPDAFFGREFYRDLRMEQMEQQ